MKLTELEQLNQEILALTKAGIPIGQGLLETSTDLAVPARLRKLTQAIGQRMDRGESVEEAVRNSDHPVPEVYAAMLELGSQTGQLTVVLEGLTEHLRRVLELRRLTISSLSYPLVLVILACLGFVFCLVPALRGISALLESSRINMPWMMQALEHLIGAATILRFVPLVILVGTTIWWVFSGRANRQSTFTRWFGWLPGVRQISRAASQATFAHFLSIVSRHEVPLDRGITLAAAATGEPQIIAEGAALSAALQQGNPGAAAHLPQAARRPAIPGTMRWLLQSARSPADLQKGLERLAETYHREVQARELWAKTFFPVLATLFVGGTATALYAFALMGPWMTSLWHLSQP